MSWNSAEKKNPPNPRKRFLQFTAAESGASHHRTLDSNDGNSPDAHGRRAVVDSDDDDNDESLVDSEKRIRFESGDDDDAMGDSDDARGASTEKGLSFLVKQRRREQQEQLRDEMSAHPHKRGTTLSESDSESSDSDTEVKVNPMSTKAEGAPMARLDQAIDESNKGARMLQRMGYKKGEGLGLNKQGRTEPVPLSGQRGNLGLGHKANKELGRDFDIRWDETREVVTEQETVAWIKCDQTPPNEATLRSWMEVGPVRFSP